MQPTATMANMYVDRCTNWFTPAKVSLMAMPKALSAMTDTAPVAAQTER